MCFTNRKTTNGSKNLMMKLRKMLRMLKNWLWKFKSFKTLISNLNFNLTKGKHLKMKIFWPILQDFCLILTKITLTLQVHMIFKLWFTTCSNCSNKRINNWKNLIITTSFWNKHYVVKTQIYKRKMKNYSLNSMK